ncbi:MAG: Gfo/Idh/MocA family oxidoreductase [Candidatus Lokiarchaeota archaeon]|nr:Gfo/Idh/MocA family oxidoreductase [Candidatus Lokiarchaeota archaeon]
MVKSVVIIGMGGHANSWLQTVKKNPEFKLTGIVDIDTELMEHMAQFGLKEDDFFVSIDDYVQDKGKPDLAIIATPIYTHHVLVKETMDLGINVICEKNMASTIYQGRQMVQCALDHPELATAIGHQYRFFWHNWLAKCYLREHNELGDLAMVRWAGAGNWGEKRKGWRRFLPEVYLEDMMPHYFDLLRYITGLDVVQVKCDTFIPRFSPWQGSSTAFANLALAHPDDYNHRHNWVWAQVYGDWQSRGPGTPDKSYQRFLFAKGEFKLGGSWLEIMKYKNEQGTEFEEEGFLTADAGGDGVEHMGTPYDGQGIILEQVNRCIDSRGKNQALNKFADIFKSFSVSMAAIESSRTGNTIWVPDYWKDMNI